MQRFVVLDEAGAREFNENFRGTLGGDVYSSKVEYDEDGRDGAAIGEACHFDELSIPRRPKWDETTTKDELDKMERESFLAWRRGIAMREEARQGNSVTPFEKNIEVWRQLWRVLERSGCVVQIVDARDPMFYLSQDLRKYAEEELGKPMMVVVNKSDFLTRGQRKRWSEELLKEGVEHLFYSAFEEQELLDNKVVEDDEEIFHDQH